MKVYPDYYKEFKCISSACKHNCCKGWDIYIDDTTANKYLCIDGELGKKLKASISFKDQAEFIMGKDRRCPFLNNDNLCEIIITLGEDALCEICRNHPRFINELPGRTEYGLGLSCEEAARIIINKKEPVTLSNAPETDDELILRRDRIISTLQNRSISLNDRITDMFRTAGAVFPEKNFVYWINLFTTFERLSDNWTKTLVLLQNGFNKADIKGFENHMQNRQYEYEQLLVYIIYRYYANCYNIEDASAICVFAYISYLIIFYSGAVLWTEKGAFTENDQTELIRTFSAEIEYSDSIIDIILNEIYNNF